ncbi:MAG: hypothetical protein V1670_01105 [Candidatus Omnitrophota bacterium]
MGKGEIKIYIDPYGNTLNMWWGNSEEAFISEEAEKTYDVIVKDKKGISIGLEKIGFFPEEVDPLKYLKKKARFLLEAKKKLITQ